MSKQYVAVTAYKILRDEAPATVAGCASDVKAEPDRFVDLGGAGAFTRGAINCLDKLGYLDDLPGGSGGHTPASADDDSLEALFDRAAKRRREITTALTKGINSGDYGVGADNVLRGPAGFRIGLDDCPGDWSVTAGITETHIRIGHTAPRSASFAAYGNIGDGLGNYFDWINENDPILVGGAPLAVTLVLKDDAYVQALTVESVDELIEEENVFSILTLGTPTTMAVYDKINEECVPHPFVISGHPAWGDPVKYPWTTGMQMSYATESILWGTWIEENLSDLLPVKVASLATDRSFGQHYELSFQEWAEANADVVSEYLPVRHDPVASSLTNEMQTVATFEPDVFLSMTAGNPCLLAMQEAGQNGLHDDINAKGGVLFTSSLCKGIEAYMAPAGDAADGWWIVGGGSKDSTDPKFLDEPFVAFANSNLEAAGLDAAVSLYGVGYSYGYAYGEALRIAAALPDGLTRANFILAVRSLSIEHPMYLDDIVTEFDGDRDAFFIEGSEFSQFDATAQAWTQIGDVVDINGQTPNCDWDYDVEACGLED